MILCLSSCPLSSPTHVEVRERATVGTDADYRDVRVYDAINRLTNVQQLESDPGNGNAVQEKMVVFGYDQAGRFDYVTRYAGLTTSSTVVALTDYEFDKTGRLTEKLHYNGNSTDSADLINGYLYTFDTANRIKSMSVESPLYKSTESVNDYSYDYQDQLTDASYADDDFDESYKYDENGNRITADNEFGDNTYSTTDNNQLQNDGTFTYTYDDEGNRESRTLIDPASHPSKPVHTTYDWDHRNRMTNVTDYTDNSETIEVQVVDYTYDDANQLLSRTVDKSSVVTTRFFVHNSDQIVLQFDGDGSSVDLTHRYLWGPQIDQQLADEHVYETVAEDRRTLWALTDHQGTVRDLAEYSDNSLINETVVWKHRRYDSFGNVQSETNRGDFDGDGDIDADDLHILYDAIGAKVFGAALDVDGDGDVDSTDINIWVTGIIESILGDSNLDGTVDGVDFLNWNANKFTQGDYDYIDGDFDGDGWVDGSDFLIWNANKWQSVQTTNDAVFDYIFGYTGRMFDDATGLQNNLNRWYDAKVGRWISEDPIGFAAGDANLYRYVGNSPTNLVDPNGLQGVNDPNGAPKEPGQQFEEICDAQKRKGRDKIHNIEKSKNRDRREIRDFAEDVLEDIRETVDDVVETIDEVVDEVTDIIIDNQNTLLVLGGAALIGATVIEDVATGGLGAANDPASIAAGTQMIRVGLGWQ